VQTPPSQPKSPPRLPAPNSLQKAAVRQAEMLTLWL